MISARQALSALSARDRRALIAGTAVIGALVVGGRLLPAWRRWQDHARSTATRLALDVARREMQLGAHRAVHDSLGARQRRLNLLRPTWLDGDTPAAAGAALAAAVSTAATHAGMTVTALDIHADSATGRPFTSVFVHATATGDIQGVATLLATLERGPPRLVVRALAVEAADAASAPNRQEVLRTELTIEGAWRRLSSKGAP